jgi:hypothetical protein
MAIKLADVLENINLAYPVIEAHEKSIIGFYNGREDTAAQKIMVGYNSDSKVAFSETGAHNSLRVRLTSSYAPAADTGFITAGSIDSLLTTPGGIFTVHDTKLYDDNNAQQSNPAYSGAYLVQELKAGDANFNDATRANVAFTSELIQQFNRYEALPAAADGVTDSLAYFIENDQDFFLAGYHKATKRTRRFKINDLVGFLATFFANELISGGVVTTSQGGGSGVVGDLNGDGLVDVNDLLILITSFGSPGVPAVSIARTLTQQTATVTPAAQGTTTGTGNGGSFLFTDFVTYDNPNPTSVNNQVYGWQDIAVTQGQANKITFDERAPNEAWYANKNLRVFVNAKITAQAPDIVGCICVIRVITQASANNDYEAAYMMHVEDTFSPNVIQATGLDAPVGTSFDAQFYYKSGTQSFSSQPLDFQPETGVLQSNVMDANTWTMASVQSDFNAGAGGGNSNTNDRIKDIEVRICLFSFAGYTEFQISDVHAYVDEELLLTTYIV